VTLEPPEGTGALPWLAQQLRTLPVDAYHLHAVFEYPLACLTVDKPVIVSFRGSDLNLGVYRRPEHLEMLLEKATVVTFVNPTQEKLARRLFGFRAASHLVPNHVSPATVQAAHLPLPRPIIGCVAEFRRVTGLDLLLEAFQRLGTGSLLLVGPFHPEDCAYYSQWIDEMTGVHRTGQVAPLRVRELVAACDLMVFPSVCEGMPNKVLESMSSGIPVLVSDVPGNRQLVEDHRHGRTFASRDVGDLLRVMKEVLAAPEAERRSWTEAALRRVQRRHDAEAERQGWLSCYRSAGLSV
jgi:glycosyltransferase involved in cell wall biosynthesis